MMDDRVVQTRLIYIFLNMKEHLREYKFTDDENVNMHYARLKDGWKTKNINFSTTEPMPWRNAGTSAYQLHETMLESDKIWCRPTSAVADSVRLQIF